MAYSLSPRERILQALAFQETDLVPYHLMIDEPVRPRLAQYFGDAAFEERITNHLPFYNLEAKVNWESSNTYVDEFGSRWRAGASPHLEQPPLQEPSLRGYQFPNLAEQETFTGVSEFFARYDRHFRLCGIAHGFFDRGWALRGMENFMMDFIAHPAFVEELFESLTAMYIALIDRIAAFPFDGIRFGDDWGYQRGVITGASRWRKFIKPGIKRIFGHAREKGLAVMLHSDGDVTELLPDLIEMGVQILNPLQPEAMDIVSVKRQYRARIVPERRGEHPVDSPTRDSQRRAPRGRSLPVRVGKRRWVRAQPRQSDHVGCAARKRGSPHRYIGRPA